MYRKFIITSDGVLRFGVVYQHRDLLAWDESCPYGGGLWEYDEQRDAILLFGRSFAFGTPEVSAVSSVDWDSYDGEPCQLLYLPHWPSQEFLQPVGFGMY